MPTTRSVAARLLALCLSLPAAIALAATGSEPASSWSIEPLGQLPLPFAANTGQFPAEACFHVAGPGPAMLFTEEGLVIRQGGGNGVPPAELRVVLVGADPLRVEAGELKQGVVNYYLGNDPERWRVGVPTHDAVHYRRAWPGIDVEYSGQTGRLKSTVRVAPGGRVEDVAMRYEGAVALRIRDDGALIVQTFAGDLVEEAPVAWQVDALGRKEPVACRFRLIDGVEVGYGVGRHDPSRELILDPEIDFSTFLGGSGDDSAAGLGPLDPATTVAGTTSSLDFPTLNPEQGESAGGRDLFFVSLTQGGDDFWYATYLGGSGDDVALDSWGSRLGYEHGRIVGWTNSTDFPMVGPRARGPRGGPSDGLWVSVGEYGALEGSMIYGGSGEDRFTGLAGSMVIGWTTSTDLPADNGPLRGPSDAIWMQVLGGGPHPLAAIAWHHYVGGNGDERPRFVIEADAPAGAAFDATLRLGGWTTSTDFPPTEPGPGDTLSGPSDGFILEYAVNDGGFGILDPVAELGGRYFGGSGDDGLLAWTEYASRYQTWSAGIHVAGWTTSEDLPTAMAWQDRLSGGRDLFFGYLDEDGATAQALSYFGGAGDEHASVVRAGFSPLLVGWTDSSDLPVVDAWQSGFGGGTDGFLAEFTLQPGGHELQRASYFGGSGDDRIADHYRETGYPGECFVLAGTTASPDFPQRRAAQDGFGAGDTDAFMARICEVAPPADGGDWELGDVIVRLDDLDDALEFAEAKLDALQSESADHGTALEMLEAKLDAPPSHADLLAELLENQAALALIEAKLDAEPDLGPVLDALDALEAKADELGAVIDEALARRELERLAWFEQLLHAKQCIPSLWLPEANEGWHEEAHDHVAELVLRAEASGDRQAHVDVARMRLSEADAALAAGEPMRGCQKLSDALRALTSP